MMALPTDDARDGSDSDGGMDDKGELVLTEYDKKRKKVAVVRGRSIVMNTKILLNELTCPICLDLLTTTMTTKECLHRFCSECISMALLRGNKECPTCRTKLVSKRSLRHDVNFDNLIKSIYPDRRKYDDMLTAANQDGDDALSSIVAFADEDEERRDYYTQQNQDMYDPFDKDAPTPPALLDSRRTTSPMEFEDEGGGRRTPPWFTVGDIDPNKLSKRDKKLFMEAQKAYLMLKKGRLSAQLTGFDMPDCEKNGSKSKNSRVKGNPSNEPHVKSRKLNTGVSKKSQVEGTGDSSSTCVSVASDADSESTEEESINAELDHDHMEEMDMMDSELFTIKTSKQAPRKPKQAGMRKDSRERLAVDQPGTSVATATGVIVSNEQFSRVRAGNDIPRFDPRDNPNPPFPDAPDYFAELMPNGKGATWQTPVDNQEQPQGDDDLDEEMVFDEDDVLSVVSIDDLLRDMGTVAHEDEVERRYRQLKPDGVFADLSKDNDNEEKEKHMCDETKMHIRELNELRAGCLADILLALEDTEQFDIGEATTWYSQRNNGEEMVYYEKSKQPLSRGRRRTTAVYDVSEEVERLGRRVTLKEIKDDMSNSESDHGTPCTLSLASSPPSSKLSLSSVHEEEEEEAKEEPPPAVDLPPLNPGQVKERLHRWIGDVTPNTPEQIDTLDRSTLEEEDDEDCESLPENYEIEAELRASNALLSRHVPPEVMQTRFIRTQHNTTIEHIGEFLYQRWAEELRGRLRPGQELPEIPRAEHFYVFNRTDRHCKCMFVHEPLVTAQTLTARADHVVIYYDTQRAEISATEMSLLEKIVPRKDRAEPTPSSSRESTGSSSSK